MADAQKPSLMKLAAPNQKYLSKLENPLKSAGDSGGRKHPAAY